MVLRKHELEAKLKDDIQLVKSGVLREDNPLDNSEGFNDLIEACRRGDLKRTQELISAGININGKNKYDYTPLNIASLCGHYELVQHLLESGALAERDTFEGERCIYNALNDRIRNLLRSYDYSKSTDPLQPLAAHISSLLTRETPITSDITIITGSDSFQLHKFLLFSRTPYFRKKLEEAPETTSWKLPQSIPVESLSAVMRYMYLDALPREFVKPWSTNTEEEILTGVDKISRQLEVTKLWEAILSSNDRRLARQRHQEEVATAAQQIESFFQNKVLGHKMYVDTKKAQDVKWRHDNLIFADCLLRADADVDDESHSKQQVESIEIPIGPVAGARVQERQSKPKRAVLYPVHKAMLIRSPYFETMFSSQFLEAQDSEFLHVIKVDCLPEVLEIILTFLYTEKVDCPLDLGLDLLYTADMLFLDKVKTKAAAAISTLGSGNINLLVDRTHTQEEDAPEVEVEPINVYDVIHAAWDLKVQRLEEFAARYLAYRLEDYIDEDEFAELIEESASRLKRREETDTIELLDDIRHYLSERFRLRFEDAGLDEMLDDEAELNEAVADLHISNGIAPPEHGQETEEQANKSKSAAVVMEGSNGASGFMKTLDGDIVEDEFASDEINYRILLGKIDTLLEKLKLDA